MQGSWLFPDGVDRERMLDMDRRIRPVRRAAFGVLALALVACGPWIGWWTIVPLLMAAVVFRAADKLIEGMARPEYGLFAAWVGSQAIIALSVAVTGGPGGPTMAWLAIPLSTLSARFSGRGVAAGLAITLGLLGAVAFGIDAQRVLAEPPVLILPAALIIASAMFQTVLMRSDLETRADAVIDPLTGLLNRKALDSRAQELEKQSQASGETVGLIVADLDHFKTVNDTHGHAAGDDVLRDVAATLRSSLRAFDLIYRLGGEEFLVLLPGAGATRTAEIAEHLRAQVEAMPTASGRGVTLSLGTTASAPDASFDYAAQFAEADAALYRAKGEGRNRVCTAEPAHLTLAA